MKNVLQAKANASRRASRAACRLLALLAALPAAVTAQTTFTENFNTSTAPGWVFGANPGDSKPFLTAATGAGGYDGSGNAIGAPIDSTGAAGCCASTPTPTTSRPSPCSTPRSSRSTPALRSTWSMPSGTAAAPTASPSSSSTAA